MSAPRVTLRPTSETRDANDLYLETVNIIDGVEYVHSFTRSIEIEVFGQAIFTEQARQNVLQLTAG